MIAAAGRIILRLKKTLMIKNKEAEYKSILSKYVPEPSVDPLFDLIKQKHIRLTIKNGRKTKLGDYRPPVRQSFHRISINKNLNAYAFLITLIHEMAHLDVWEKYGTKVRPHGFEWKKTFTELMNPFLNLNVFPENLEPLVISHLQKGYASTTSDLQLTRALLLYDADPAVLIQDLPETSLFSLDDGRTFRKKHRLRKRYLCYCLDNQKNYLFSPTARVTIQSKK